MVGFAPCRWIVHGGRPECQRLQSVNVEQLICNTDAASRIIYGFAERRGQEIATIVLSALSCVR